VSTVLEMIDAGDVCSLLALIAVLALIGHKMVQETHSLYLRGWRLATAAFLAYCLYAGFVFQPTDAQGWLWAVFRGLLAAGLTLGVSWIALSVLAFAKHHLLDTPAKRARDLAESSKQRRREAEHRRQEEERESLRQERDAEERSRQLHEQTTKAEAQRRRVEARAAAELSFSLFGPKLENRFTREMLQEYISTYMGDDQPPEDVERRGQELIATLQRHLEQVEPPETKRTLEDLSRWLEEEKARIVALPIDEKAKRSYVAALNVRFNELSTKLFEELEP